jgi:hypothetical protein
LQTNCGHNFCKDCITNYYNKSLIEYNNINNCFCPYCRQNITSLNRLELVLLSNTN